MRIVEVEITPIAIPDAPLANTKGVHPADFQKAIIEIRTDNALIGLGETCDAIRTLSGLRKAAFALEGLDPHDLRDLQSLVEEALPNSDGANAPTALADYKAIDVVYGAI